MYYKSPNKTPPPPGYGLSAPSIWEQPGSSPQPPDPAICLVIHMDRKNCSCARRPANLHSELRQLPDDLFP